LAFGADSTIRAHQPGARQRATRALGGAVCAVRSPRDQFAQNHAGV
jgi:hypothetical protein